METARLFEDKVEPLASPKLLTCSEIMVRDIKKRFPEIAKLISYQDTEAHKGTIYAAGNWTKCSEVMYRDWNTEKRKRNEPQSKANKVRWEYHIGCSLAKPNIGYITRKFE